MECLRLTETNDWEGESWNFYFEATPEKETALRELLVSIEPFSDSYELSDTRFPIDVVKTLLAYGNDDDDCTYMDKHNYVGELTSVPIAADFENADPFYKGCFVNFCTPRSI